MQLFLFQSNDKITINRRDSLKIFIVCSTSFYSRIKPIKEELEKKNYEIILPNSYDESTTEHDYSNKIKTKE